MGGTVYLHDIRELAARPPCAYSASTGPSTVYDNEMRSELRCRWSTLYGHGRTGGARES